MSTAPQEPAAPRWTRPRGTARADGWEVAITPDGTHWHHTSLHVAHLGAGESRRLRADGREHVVVPLRGSVHVTAEDADGRVHQAPLAGRRDVFAAPTDIAYTAAGLRITVSAPAGPARVAVAGARVFGRGAARPPFRHLAADEAPVERRGTGNASREVRNLGTPGVLDADAIIVCEVVTPAGNFSSWPPHKHDTEHPGEETRLEEIYYVETAPADPRATDPTGYLRVRASDPDRPIDVLAQVRAGDVVLVPHGWHGPAIAAPDTHMYYLNVMAGPGPERAWLICDDPAHAWIRDTWSRTPFDPRLPLADSPGNVTPEGAGA
ncbi:5-deoxy-glucuronate isomerase [Streptomyces litmocidini]|uniref:5-deoxy-glucuronate isomerase n=1 Tax=Streptomyces litmocidini TaxID=67318 RepID=UPI00167DCB62|nr:5-deoxy-glucuronate isomerase [Streptomyces litmocidini]GGU80334.1 5-deoxy-glucuronate isomerase [Streptomyces litmocidini]